MQERKIDELISYFNRKVADMNIEQTYKMELLGMITAIGIASEKESKQAEPEIIYCKDCRKFNLLHGHYCDGQYIGIKDYCPLISIRGLAVGHEFDYQFCAYAERKEDGQNN